METICKILFNKVGKHRPNAINHRITIPMEMVKELGITQDDREVKVTLVDGKIIIEKVNKI